MEIGTAIKTIRKSKSWNQEKLSSKTGLSVNAISQIELNSAFPRKKNIDIICNAFDIPISYLLFFSITEEDIPKDKSKMFNFLADPIKTLLLK